MPDTVPEIASIDRGSCWPMRAAIVAAVLIAFGFSARYGFVAWGDPELITGNHSFTPPTLSSLSHIWRRPDQQMYMPVIYTAWWGLACMRGASANSPIPIVFHSANLL